MLSYTMPSKNIFSCQISFYNIFELIYIQIKIARVKAPWIFFLVIYKKKNPLPRSAGKGTKKLLSPTPANGTVLFLNHNLVQYVPKVVSSKRGASHTQPTSWL